MYYGYVDLEDPTRVDEAIERLSNTILMGREIKIEKYLEHREKESYSHDDDGNVPLGERISDHSREDYGDRAYQLHVSFKAQILGVSDLIPIALFCDLIMCFHALIVEGGHHRRQFTRYVPPLWAYSRCDYQKARVRF